MVGAGYGVTLVTDGGYQVFWPVRLANLAGWGLGSVARQDTPREGKAMNTTHHHYFNTTDNESVCVECNNATDYCLEDSVRVPEREGLALEAKRNAR